MVRERVRWSIIQMAIVGLQGLPRAQIVLITVIQLAYFVVISLESKSYRIFMSLWLKLKILFQELAILVFLLVLCIFSFAQNSDVRTSQSFEGLVFVVIVSMLIAVACEVLLMVYTIFNALASVVRSMKKNKNLEDQVGE